MPDRPIIRHLSDTPVTPCPCGEAFRMITADDGGPISFHITRIRGQAKRHRHHRVTETYYCLEGFGQIELDGEVHDFSPGMAVMIPPGVVHAASGDITIVNAVCPAFDPSDEEVVE